MKQISGNLWDWHDAGHWVAIPTNGCVNARGEAVMGCGLALQAKRRFPQLPTLLGARLQESGNQPYAFVGLRLVTIPTKDDFRHDSSLYRIEQSCRQLDAMLHPMGVSTLYVPLLGCGAGRLHWADVRPVIEGAVHTTALVAVVPL